MDIESFNDTDYEPLKSIHETYDIHTVYITSDENIKTLHLYETKQADDYLTKPVSSLVLNEIVHSILENINESL